MRIAVLLLAAALLVPSLAEARTGACRTGDVPRVKARTDTTKVGSRYAVVACDAARRMRVLRRTRYRASVRGSIGRRITDAEAAGRHVVWAELVHRRRKPMRAVVVEADRRGRVARRRTVWARRADPNLRLDVAVLRDGSVAWSVPGRPDRGTVMLARPGKRPRALRQPFVQFLGSDDGRTLRWETERSRRLVHRDVLPVPVREGCPRRPRSFVLSETAEHRVSARAFAIEEETSLEAVVRVCVRAARRDVVVAQSSGSERHDVPIVAGPWAVVTTTGGDKYDGCIHQGVKTVSLGSGRAVNPSFVAAPGCRHVPEPGSAHAVTSGGRLAWIDPPEPPSPPSYGDEPVERQEVLRATAPGGRARAVELDRGDPGEIANLRADGETYRWTHAGEPRSAPAP